MKKNHAMQLSAGNRFIIHERRWKILIRKNEGRQKNVAALKFSAHLLITRKIKRVKSYESD